MQNVHDGAVVSIKTLEGFDKFLDKIRNWSDINGEIVYLIGGIYIS